MFFIPFRQGGSDTVFPQIPKPKHWALGSGPSSNCFYLIKIKRKKGRSCQKRCWNEFIKERWCEIHRWLVYHQPQLPSPPPSLRTFLVAAATAIAPFLMAEGNGTLIFFFFSLFLLPITSWSCFSFLCPSYSSLWILVNYGVQELEPEGLTFKSDSVVLAYIKNEGELKQLHLRKVLSLWWGQGDCTVSSRQLSVGSWSHIVLLPAACSKTGWQWKWNLLQILSQHDPGSSQQTSIRMFASACDWVTSLL